MSSSAITYKLRDYVLNSSLTSSSFYQIRENIHSSYLARFMRFKHHYQSIVDQHRLHVRQSIAESFSDSSAISSASNENIFSNFDSDNGYCETTGIADKYCESIFNSFLDPLIPYIEKILGNVPPHFVQSFDHTYNVAGRVTLPGDDSSISISEISESVDHDRRTKKTQAIFTAMGGNNQIEFHNIAKGSSREEGLVPFLTHLLEKCNRLGCRLPKYFTTDNAHVDSPCVKDLLSFKCPVDGANYEPIILQDIVHIRN